MKTAGRPFLKFENGWQFFTSDEAILYNKTYTNLNCRNWTTLWWKVVSKGDRAATPSQREDTY
jgi:hypothetical protein